MPRPVNLNLWTIAFPVTAIVSILHRLSGVLLFLAVPLLLWAFSLSLSSSDGFTYLQAFLAKSYIKILLWGFLTALIYHLFAGIRHFVMDLGHGESLSAGRISAYLVISVTLVFAALLGICIW